MTPLHGLVLCGGLSSRMGKEKFLLDYHGKPQWLHIHEMLEDNCDAVSLSCSPNQQEHFPSGIDTIPDEPSIANIGPMAALLSAFRKLPDRALLVVGCDYPMLEADDLKFLVDNRGSRQATCFVNEVNIVEPLVAIYEYGILAGLLNHFKSSNYSLRDLLSRSEVKLLQPPSYTSLKSADTPAAVEEVLSQLNKIRPE